MKPNRNNLEKHLATQITGAVETVKTVPQLLPEICDAAELIIDALLSGGKILTAGNGGSAAEAMHMAEELSGRYKGDRVSLPGISLTADGTALTCIANDFGYDEVFSRQIEGIGTKGDILVIFSTSGNSRCLGRAFETAKVKGMKVISLLGKSGGALAGRSDVEMIIGGECTAHIQECHQIILHALLEAVEVTYVNTPERDV